MLSIKHTDTLNIATETFSVGEKPAIKLIHFEICNDQQQLSTLGPKNIGTNLQEHYYSIIILNAMARSLYY